MGSGQSKKEGELTNRNNNGKNLQARNDRNTLQNDGRELSSTTTTTPQTQQVEAKRNVPEVKENDSISNQATSSVEDNGYRSDVKNGYFDNDGPTLKTTTAGSDKSPVNAKGHLNNLVEFVDTSDEESDTDSLLGIGISKTDNNPRRGWGDSKSEKQAKSLNLPLPAPSKQPNHSVVFEQERALNQYNIEHGYTQENLPWKKPKNQKQTHVNVSEDFLPESYAQKLQRDQYRKDQSLMVREKTIYRNPDDWDLEESIVQTFDAERFKAANQVKATEARLENDQAKADTQAIEDIYQAKQKSGKTKRATPSYNSDDEDLMNAIEDEFDL